MEVRASSLPGYIDCARRAAVRQYSKEIKAAGYTLRETSPSAGARIGTALHELAAGLLRHRQDGEILDVNVIAQQIEETWSNFSASIKDGIEWDSTTKNSHDARLQLEAMSFSLIPVLQSMLPDEIESAFSAQVPIDGVDLILTGHLDVLESTGTLSDFKTGAREPSPWSQLGAYALLAQAHGKTVDLVQMVYVPRVRTTQDQPAPIIRELDAGEATRAAWSTLREIARHKTAFDETGDIWAFPANPMSQMCTPKYCSAFGTDACKIGKQVKEQVK